MQYVLGIDTSNYKTSLCAIRLSDGTIMADARRLLPVEHGERGLRQSDALFFHVRHLPEVMDDLICQLKARIAYLQDTRIEWVGVGVSVRPRPLAHSYMPVFLAGQGFGHSFARALGLVLVQVSHQEGHVAAATHSIREDDEPFIAVHLSGGTSDVLLCRPYKWSYKVDTLGEGSDLHAGQFVDRVGVALGLPFPAGPHLEKLAETPNVNSLSDAEDTHTRAQVMSDWALSSTVRNCRLSFSGPCSAALRAVEQGVSHQTIARAVEHCIANSVVKAVLQGLDRKRVRRLVIAGGVASNQYIRNRITHRLQKVVPDVDVFFGPVEYSSDSALGPALIARRYLLNVYRTR